MPTPSKDASYAIAGVSKLTGLSCHAIRVWERRYGFPSPMRTPSGHRRYPADQVGLLKEVVRKVHDGQAICQAIARTREEGCRSLPDEATDPRDRCSLIRALQGGDLARAEAEFQVASAGRSVEDLVALVIEPALVAIGEGWFRGRCEIHQERCASGFFRRKLHGMFDEAQRRNGQPRGSFLVGSVQGDRHEGGVLIVSLLLERAGWRAIPLGVDLPIGEFRAAIDRWRPDALALSFVLSRNIRKRFAELAEVGPVPVFVGGRSILNYRSLARSHGLIPLIGPATSAVPQMIRALQGRPASKATTADRSNSEGQANRATPH